MEREWILKEWKCGEKYSAFLQCLKVISSEPSQLSDGERTLRERILVNE